MTNETSAFKRFFSLSLSKVGGGNPNDVPKAKPASLKDQPTGLTSFLDAERQRIQAIEDNTAAFISDISHVLRACGVYLTDAYQSNAIIEKASNGGGDIRKYGVKWINNRYTDMTRKDPLMPNKGIVEMSFIYTANRGDYRTDFDVFFYHGIRPKIPGNDIITTGRDFFLYNDDEQPSHIQSLRATQRYDTHEELVKECETPTWFVDHLKKFAMAR